MRGGTTDVTYPNVGPDWKFTVIGALEFNRLNRSKSNSTRWRPPIKTDLLVRRFTTLMAAPCWAPNGSRSQRHRGQLSQRFSSIGIGRLEDVGPLPLHADLALDERAELHAPRHQITPAEVSGPLPCLVAPVLCGIGVIKNEGAFDRGIG